jgi:NTE family protein
MARLGLLLGGGGSVGIAWENGVLAGLVDAISFDPAASTVIVGTSAGSSVGADMALGKDPHDALARDGDPENPRRAVAVPDLENGPFAEIIGLMMSPDARTPEFVARIGELAINAETAMSEDEFVDMFHRSVGTDEWPTVDFRATAACCETGQPRFWSASDGIDLSRAVASSCAIPGFFPTVTFADDHYMDGSRGRNYHASIVADLDLDAAIYIGPRIAVPGVSELIEADMNAIAATGVCTHTMLGSDRLDAADLNLMDFTKRPDAFAIGMTDGNEHAAAVAELTN